MPQSLGNLFILAAPSGAGKSSLIKALLQNHDATEIHNNEMQVSVSHTTRAPRPGEIDGVHYHFVSREVFQELISQDEFFEWAEVFGNYYGTSKVVIEQTLRKGIDVFLDIDWQGARQVKAQIPDTATIFVAPPSRDELLRRLTERGQDTPEVIQERMNKAVSEISHYHEFDYIVVNDDFDAALAELDAIVSSRRLRKEKQVMRHQSLFENLLAND
ncbi:MULTISPECIES: guanylate kinase [Paraglaciecola]|jgi:guanylate kinase|uniref:Guanylate kinase n=4 Tax=Paraglaciecola TaxID=1621534 RepID=A0A8H9ICH6_9ALTE|nr:MULTISPECIES: guanylate kinase [Paraglaciecola]AEE21402.1 guanylate kinase [Glaciecola sp. 4H-3-7+YE-5]MBN24683.1 guanylate kinase [Alteromonadaceae bacterium]MBJ2137600.1 guanylate kinase [Paraglaciecola chathamensis]MBU3019053.1 guanylate kinase [Paraglaciecola agarilytica]MDO6560616.1 guanylate kinase [Paraglaciecola chathamensis]|tara:strand:- start:78 stop:725 length:648 start_codon:yes stop_codon:yes gene_type:complete